MNLFKYILVSVATLAGTGMADLDSFVPKSYSAGYGTELVISKKSGFWLKIDVVGDYGHTCSFNGKILDHRATDAESGCYVDIRQVTKDSVVTMVDDPICGCGMRVSGMLGGNWSTGYKRCDLKKTNREFLKLYKKKDYGAAAGILTSFLDQCGKYIDYADRDRVYNDLAITRFHDIDREGCREAVKSTMLYSVMDSLENFEEDFQKGLKSENWFQRDFFEGYKKLGPAIYYNYNLCQDPITLKDPRDGKTYETVRIDNQVWMSENLNYASEKSFCYDNEQALCDRYGRLYTWHDALTACPEGWRLPTKEDFLKLIKKAGGKRSKRDPASWLNAGKALKSEAGWFYEGKSRHNGKNTLGFNALSAGERSTTGEFENFATWTNFWSSTQGDLESSAETMGLHALGDDAMQGGSTKTYGFSVRCIMNK